MKPAYVLIVAERYATATEAHSLKVDTERSGAADVLIAAGLAGDGLGVSLVRLRAEFDTARGAVRGTGNSSLTEHMLALMRLRTLREVKEMVGDLSAKQAAVTGFRSRHLLAITGRVLDVFLDPLCHHCEGRGFNGGGRHEQTGPPALCRPCGGSGHRAGAIGHTDAERAFSRHMLALLERSATRAEGEMARRLR